jgi:hypothetical protein
VERALAPRPGARRAVAQRAVARRAAARPGLARAVAAAAATMAALSLAGCAKMDQALDKQWMTVDFSPATPAAAALRVRAACSHVANTPALPLPAKASVINVMYGVGYDTTNSSPAELAQLQVCLGKFKSVLGVEPQTAGDEGS